MHGIARPKAPLTWEGRHHGLRNGPDPTHGNNTQSPDWLAMTAESYSSDTVRDLYEQVTDLMAHAMGGYLHGGYYAAPNLPDTMEEAADILTDVVVERCRLAAGQRVLDVGSGNGKATLRVAAAHQVQVTGITLSAYQVALSRKLAEEQRLAQAVNFCIADMQNIPFPDGMFDAAFAIESVCHVTDRMLAFTEIDRVLRTGARVAVTDFVLRRPILDSEKRAIVETINADFQIAPILPRESYEAVVRAAGLEVVEFTDIGEAVRPSFAVVADNMRKAKSTVEKYMSDEEFYKMVDALERFGSVTEIGYAVVVAQKPV
jgi:cyclopropane fatty-acyl-phospholipid synthase-like methyltransferase